MFALMVSLWCLATRNKKLFGLIALVWFGYGIAMEFVQRYCVSNRSFDIWDIAADGAGCVLGLYLVRRYIKK